MSVAAWAAATYVDVSGALLAVSTVLECATPGHHIGLVWIRHIIVFLLAECLTTVGRHRSPRGTVDHSAAVACIRERVVGRTLIVHRLVLRSTETAMDALAYHLVERAAHLLLGLIVVDHALCVRLA